MLCRIEVKGFRALRFVALGLGAFHVLVGPNASGKSTFMDVLGFLRDLLTVGLEGAVLGDARFGVSQRAPDPKDLSWMREGEDIEIAVEAFLPEGIKKALGGAFERCRYELAISVGEELALRHENLFLCRPPNGRHRQKPRQLRLFPDPQVPPTSLVIRSGQNIPTGWRKVVSKIGRSGNDYFRSEISGWNNLFRLGPHKSALANLPEDTERFPAAIWFKRLLMEGVQRVMLNPEAMRLPSPTAARGGFAPDGSNLPWVIQALRRQEPEAFGLWVDHLKTALLGLEDIAVEERKDDRARYLVLHYANGLRAPSWLVSEGTLRLLALTLLATAPVEQRIVLIEEPENGVHPRAIESILQSLSSVYDRQILCASHSPIVLNLVGPEQILCFGRAGDGAVDIVAGSEHPRLREWQGQVQLGDLFAAGIL